MTKKVLVLNPPTPVNGYINRDLMGGMGVAMRFGGDFFSRLISRVKSNYIHIPVMQLVYGATLLHGAGFDVLVIDASNENKNVDDVLKKASNFNPDFVVMAVSSSGIIFEREVMAASLKKSFPSVKIIAVGDMLTEMPELIQPWFDIDVTGELENNIVSLCKGENPEDIPGLILNKNGQVLKTGPGGRLQQKELEELPLPHWDLFPYKTYRYYPMLTATPVAAIQASRGCPYDCGYCPYTKNQGKQWRARRAENIFEEIIHDMTYGFQGFIFRDPLFSLDKKRVENLCNMIIDKKIKIQFVVETRPELLDDNLIKKMRAAGCCAINFGIEDIHPDILRNVNRKPIETDRIIERVQQCEQIGIRTSCFFILGLPGSTKQTIEETIQFSKKLFASQTEYKIATPYPGTELYKMAKKNNWLTSESFDVLTGYTSSMQISKELTPEYLEQKSNEAFRQYYFSPRYLLREIVRGRILKNIYFAIKNLK